MIATPQLREQRLHELFPEWSLYADEHPHVRLLDYADGYIWTRPH